LVVLLVISMLFTACGKTDSNNVGQDERSKKQLVNLNGPELLVYPGLEEIREFVFLQ